MTTPPANPGHDRREFLAYFSSIGLSSTLLPGVLWSKVAAGAEITKDTIAAAEEIAGVAFTEDERTMMVRNLTATKTSIDNLRKIPLDNGVSPAIIFDPLPPGATAPIKKNAKMIREKIAVMARPTAIEELAFLTVSQLSELVRTRKVKPSELTQMYLDRLKRYDPTLKCVITLTEGRAMTQARAADAEIAAGKYRGPLHGIPWGAKDLLAAKGYKTTWGAGPYKEQTIDVDAEVVKRLDAAGAILIAKLTMGELAQGDNWFGGITRNPWWPEQGSSGSSAGPASATAAGCVGFSIGTETQGSISSPSTRCGVSGLRPTFGRVPRTGAMALAWSMDKLGPICRSAEDCALVLNAIYGPDGLDMAVRDIPFNWDATLKPSALRVGYAKAQFDAPERGGDPANPDRITHRLKQHDDEALETLKRIGATLIPVEVPTGGVSSGLILQPEAGAAFEELVRSGHIKEMVQQSANAWPNTFRAASFVPAITYINANRARILMMQKWWDLFKNIDVLVIPTGAGGEIQQTNLTGNPSVIIPHGFRESQPLGGGGGGAPVAVRPDSAPPVQQAPRPNTPVSLTFLGPLYQEEKPLALAHAFQKATDFHLKRPPGFTG